MAGSLNEVTLIGNVGNDPEIKVLQSGGKVANFSVATSESWRDKTTGEKKEKTEWSRIVVWQEGLVKIIEQYVKKGSKILVRGKLQTRKWQDQSGQDRYSTEVVLQGFGSQLILLGDGKGGGNRRDEDGDAGDFGAPGPSSAPPRRAGSAGRPHNDMDDDIPF